MAKPIAITLGDPAGVGPEVVLKTVLTTPQPKHPWILIGSLWSLQRSAGALGLPMPDIDEINSIAETTSPVSLLQPGACPAPADFAFGKVQVACGELAVRSVEFAARACLAAEVSAMVTAPIHK